MDRSSQALLLRKMNNMDKSDRAVDLNRPLITPVRDDFHAGDRTRLQISEHGIPIVGWSITQAERNTCLGRYRPRTTFPAQSTRRTVEQILEHLVKTANAPKSRS